MTVASFSKSIGGYGTNIIVPVILATDISDSP